MNGMSDATDGRGEGTSGATQPGHSGRGPLVGQQDRSVAAAREAFAAGQDDARGIRPEIVLSWHRCRDQYRVDPSLSLAPPAPDYGGESLDRDVIFTKLGGLGAMMAREVSALDAVVTVTDGGGRLLASWGDPPVLHRAAESNLAPWAAWSEEASGTNGMGTALEGNGPIMVQGAEHWCEGFQHWSCLGISIPDVVGGEPLAALNVSCWNRILPERASSWLSEAVRSIQSDLRQRACQNGAKLTAAFADAVVNRNGATAVFDAGGRIVTANKEACYLLGIPSHTQAVDPAHRDQPQIPALMHLVRRAVEQAKQDSKWLGSTQVYSPFIDGFIPVTLHPVQSGANVIGMIVYLGVAEGDLLPLLPARKVESHPVLPVRIVAQRDTGFVLLAPSDIRFAESNRDTVWLMTDQGRLRAAAEGLDNLEEELRDEGFLRVHRCFLVNLSRVREIERPFKGTLWLITDSRSRECIPVSRRRVPILRTLLHL